MGVAQNVDFDGRCFAPAVFGQVAGFVPAGERKPFHADKALPVAKLRVGHASAGIPVDRGPHDGAEAVARAVLKQVGDEHKSDDG